ncbi:DNA mismatch repair protein MutS, partial [Candidatus Woesearchaeota archaeon]|nr:DNA mismatch repair protein MutS [Candidatus Woesearchaeota archaeon]
MELTPGMRQYMEIKDKHPDCIVLFRMGDFYETFFEDAKTVSRVLDITLTARGKGEKRAPLAGIPYHALDNYLAKLVKRGFKVCMVEQLEDPKKTKGLVKRGVTRIVTPGTVIEDNILTKSNNF